MTFNYFFEINNEHFVVNSSRNIALPSSYSMFINHKKCNEILFHVNINYDSEVEIGEEKLLIQLRTYKWSLCNNKLYFAFTKRNSNLEDDNHPWIIEIDGNYCNLHIPSFKLNNDLFDCPWLHRLFSYFLSTNKVLSHGGCFEIDGEGCLVLGECGKGKSTFLSFTAKAGYRVLCDDRMMLELGSEIVCCSTPWNTKNPNLISKQPCKIRYIVFVDHSYVGYNEVISLDYKTNIDKIISQFYLPIPKNQLQALVQYAKRMKQYNIKIWNFNFLPNLESVDILVKKIKHSYVIE